MVDLATFLKTQDAILLDGGMGTQLADRGLNMSGQTNLSNPQEVLEIHRAYSQLGCHILITNTLTMNRIYIETHNINIEVKEVNLAGAQLAREIAGKEKYVLGDISSTGQLLEPYGTYKKAAFCDAFKEQAEILGESGVDGFIIETMCDLREALCALRACKDSFSLPVIVSLAFMTETKGGRTIMGDSAKECAKIIEDNGAEAVGANCGDLDPFQMAEVISLLKSATSLPILAQPNAGKPQLIGTKTEFNMNPQVFASGIVKCLDAGANLVGGCCGTSPKHIQAIAMILKEKSLISDDP